MTIKEFIWKSVLDPIVRKIESRLEHYRSLRSVTHDGRRWKDSAFVGKSVVFYDEAALTNGGERKQLSVGDFCHIRGEINVLGTGSFEIGHHSFLGPDSRIWCRHKVKIGSHVLISHLVDIHDSSSHSLDWRARRSESEGLFEHGNPQPGVDVAGGDVIIEDDVWIGFKSSILKGVTIGRGAVVAACSVVTKDVPAYTLVAGNPARIVRELPR